MEKLVLRHGKDYFSLLSEMNGGNGDRNHGIDLTFGEAPHISPNLNEDPTIEWKDEEPDTCERQGWVEYDEDGDELPDEDEEDDEWDDEGDVCGVCGGELESDGECVYCCDEK